MTTEEIWPVPVMAGGGLPLSSCCNEPLEVQREVNDTVAYSPEGYDPETKTLTVRYLKVYEGDAGSFSIECTRCHHEVECEVEEL
jgi:hypothetical protein